MYLVLDPALALLSVYYAVVFGILYLVIVTASTLLLKVEATTEKKKVPIGLWPWLWPLTRHRRYGYAR